ncbi:type I glyceraldehyde-3-phosphate dehydrogenase [Propionivibrio dicarboxylicus]|nr:glyceraldehyde 3-phosphate dehydrogenase NAD-binding domain-containing protein [Propionivibrio dicarboxylicus]
MPATSTMNRPFRLAINGYGRIGRSLLRAIHASPLGAQVEIVAINEPAALETMAYLTRYDSTHGVFPGDVAIDDDHLRVDGRPIRISHATTPEDVDWRALDLDLVVECSGRYSKRPDLERFLAAGCPRVLVSQPCANAEAIDRTIVQGLNQQTLDGSERLVSNASCTTNAVVPVLDRLHRAFGVDRAFITTLHSVMNDQPLIDGYNHPDLRRTRSAMQSIIPVSTGLAHGVERLLPELRGRVDAKAIRVPIVNVSTIDLTVTLRHDVDAAGINALMAAAAAELPDIFGYCDHPSASIDFNHDPHSAVIDASVTRCNGGRLANLLIWFDNEWAFANRLLDVATHWCAVAHTARRP